MIMLKEQVAVQDIYFIPRNYTFDKVVFTGETTLESEEFLVTPMISSYYSHITIAPTLKEGFTYVFKVYNGDEIVYYDRVYCTNQDIADFSVNDGEYVEQVNPPTNGFIVLD